MNQAVVLGKGNQSSSLLNNLLAQYKIAMKAASGAAQISRHDQKNHPDIGLAASLDISRNSGVDSEFGAPTAPGFGDSGSDSINRRAGLG